MKKLHHEEINGYTIDEYPARDRSPNEAKYVVEPKYENRVVAKTRTLKEARNIVKKMRRL